jgi:hypothetical protein
LQEHIDEFGVALNLTLALREPIAEVASRSLPAFDAAGDIGLAGAACFGTSVNAAFAAQLSISVSVEASASLTASSS